MANTLKFGNGQWYGKKDTILAYNDENKNYKPLPFSFDRASSATVVNKEGLIETVGSGEPRIDYKDDSEGALLLEPTRSNLVTNSDDFGNSDWNRGTGTITTNTSISPDGTLSADKYSVVSTSSFAFLSQTKSADASQSYTYSIWIKKVSGSGVLKLAISDVNLATSTSNNINLTNEFVRYSFSIATGDLSNTGSIGAGFVNITSGDVIEVWGAQLEQGSYATSYIPTSGGIATRTADVCVDAGNSTVFNDSEGVLFTEITALANDGTTREMALSDGGPSNRIEVRYISSDNDIQAVIRGAASTIVLSYNLSDATEFAKVAVKYKSGDYALWVGGVERAVSTTTGTPTGFSQFAFDDGNGGFNMYSKVKDVRVYNTALTDQELIALTS